MKLQHLCSLRAAAAAGVLLLAGPAMASTTISTFDDYIAGALYASWAAPTATIVSGPTAYVVTATGYGSNWKYVPVDATGNTNVELTVTLSGPPAADGHLGPIITLVDADGTSANYAWYGQTLGSHVLNMAVSAPTWIGAPGTTPGLDVSKIEHLHLQLDPGGFGNQGAYTVSWENLRLTGSPPPAITQYSYNTTSKEFTLRWTSSYGILYNVVYSTSPAGPFTPLMTDIFGDDVSTETTVTMPDGLQGFLRVEEQQ